jgi:hypothetical protein
MSGRYQSVLVVIIYLLCSRIPVDRPESPEEGEDSISNANAIDCDTPFAQTPFRWWKGMGELDAAPEDTAHADGVCRHQCHDCQTDTV